MACHHLPTLYDALFRSTRGRVTTCRLCGRPIKSPNDEGGLLMRGACLPGLIILIATIPVSAHLFGMLQHELGKIAFFIGYVIVLALLQLAIGGICNYYFGHYVSADTADMGPTALPSLRALADEPDQVRRPSRNR